MEITFYPTSALDVERATRKIEAEYPAFIRAGITATERDELRAELEAMRAGDMTTHFGSITIQAMPRD